jgi:hypothetical protein
MMKVSRNPAIKREPNFQDTLSSRSRGMILGSDVWVVVLGPSSLGTRRRDSSAGCFGAVAAVDWEEGRAGMNVSGTELLCFG